MSESRRAERLLRSAEGVAYWAAVAPAIAFLPTTLGYRLACWRGDWHYRSRQRKRAELVGNLGQLLGEELGRDVAEELARSWFRFASCEAIDVMRLLALASHREEIRRITVSVHPHVATYLGNRKRQQLAKLEGDSNLEIQISFDDHSPAEHLKIECYDANSSELRIFSAPAPGQKRGH